MRYGGWAVTYIAIHFGLPSCLIRPASFPGRTAHPGESAGGGRCNGILAVLVQIFRGNVHLIAPDNSSALDMGGEKKIGGLQGFVDGFFQKRGSIEDSSLTVGKVEEECVVWTCCHFHYNPVWHIHISLQSVNARDQFYIRAARPLQVPSLPGVHPCAVQPMPQSICIVFWAYRHL